MPSTERAEIGCVNWAPRPATGDRAPVNWLQTYAAIPLRLPRKAVLVVHETDEYGQALTNDGFGQVGIRHALATVERLSWARAHIRRQCSNEYPPRASAVSRVRSRSGGSERDEGVGRTSSAVGPTDRVDITACSNSGSAVKKLSNKVCWSLIRVGSVSAASAAGPGMM